MMQTGTETRPPLAWMWWIPATVWACFIFYLSSKHADEFPKIDIPQFDKVVHLCLYGPLSLLIFCALRFGSARSFQFAAILAFLLASIYGVSDEFHQSFVPTRTCDVWDWVADTTGGSVVFLAKFFRPKGPPPV